MKDYSVTLVAEVDLPISESHTPTAEITLQMVTRESTSAKTALDSAIEFLFERFDLTVNNDLVCIKKIDICPVDERE